MPMNDYEVDLDFRGDSPTDLEGESVLPEGKYHIIITGLKRESDPACMRFRYQVVAGTVPQAVGATGSERFYLSMDAMKRMKILAHRLGLVKDTDIGTRTGALDLRPAVGRELVVEIINEQFVPKKEQQKAAEEGRSPKFSTSSKWTFAGFWPPEDSRAAGVPLDPQTAARVRSALGTVATPYRPSHQQAPPAPVRQTTIPTASSAYDDI